MWLSDLTQLPALIRDLIALQQETNLLLREMIAAQTGTRAQSLRTRLSSDPLRPKLTAQAVTRHDRSDWARIQQAELARTAAPWRADPADLPTTQALPAMPPDPSHPASTADSPSRPADPRSPTSSPGPPPDPAGAR